MSDDLVHRLRESVRACRALDRSALLAEAADEIERLGLTEEEREAIAAGLGALERLYEDSPPISQPIYEQHAPTLRGLLERRRLRTMRSAARPQHRVVLGRRETR